MRKGRLFYSAKGCDATAPMARGCYGLARMLEATGTGAEALEAHNTFLDIWAHRDQCYREVRQFIPALQGD